jgi:6,7-dimethyl-8-ribityllumazine synthase
MIRDNETGPAERTEGRFAIVCSEYNRQWTGPMLDAALAGLETAGSRDIEVVRVPGAYEIPVAAATLARRPGPRPDAILCLGLILRGETDHADHVGRAVSRGLMDIALDTGVPCIHEVLTVATEEQAIARCVTPATNRGTEAARTAVAMARVLATLRRPSAEMR